MNKTILWIVIGLVVIIGAVLLLGKDRAETVPEENEVSETTETSSMESQTPGSESESETSPVNTTGLDKAPGDAPLAVGTYEEYSPEKIALAESGDVVLFFHATWCPSCRALNSDIEKSLDDIPSDVSILKLDYDKETALKQKYGVTTQHTLVQVDAEGNLIQKWSGGSTLETIVSRLQ